MKHLDNILKWFFEAITYLLQLISQHNIWTLADLMILHKFSIF